MQSGRLNYLDYSKGLAIISVVCIHIIDRMGLDFSYKMDNVAAIIKSLSYLPMFFIISGSLYRKTLDNKLISTLNCFIKTSKNSLLPFYSLSVIFLFLHLIGSFFSNEFKSINSMTNALLTFDISEQLPSGVLWFLFVLYLIQMTMIVWIRYFKANLVILLIFSIILNLLSFLFVHIHFMAINNYTISLCYFVFGYYFSEKLLKLNWNLQFASYCFLAYVIAISFSLYHTGGDRISWKISSFLGPISVLLIFRWLEFFYKNNITLKILDFIGINSLIVFVFHTSCFIFIKPMIYRMGLQNSYAGFFLWLIAGIIGPLVIGEVLALFPTLYRNIFFREPSGTMRGIFVLRGNKC
jgi:fucose 4-O-acetylase-like acetyltransferase